MKLKNLFCLSVLLAILTLFQSNSFGANIIPNPGFELGTGDNFTNWGKWNGAASLLSTTTAGEYRSGGRALKAVVAVAGNPYSVQLVSDLVPTVIGESYTFKIYVKGAISGTNIRFSTNPSSLYSSNYTVTTDWVQLSWTFTANASQTRIVLDLGANANTYYIDDMDMQDPAPKGANIIPNPGFEIGTGDDFTNWGKWNGASSLLATTTSDEFRNGNRALKAVVAADGNPWSVQLVSDLIPTIIGQSYTFKIYVKALNSGTTVRFSTNPSSLYSSNYTVSTSWTQFSWTFTANATQTRICLDMGAKANTYFLDDMEMLEPIITVVNLLKNGGFEDGSGDDFTNWGKWNGSTSLFATTTSGEYRNGSRALKTVVASNGNPWSVQLVSDPVNTVIGASYKFSIYVKAATAATTIRFSTNPNSLYSSNCTVTSAYTLFSWTFVANSAQTRIVFDLGANANTYFLDDAVLEVLCGVTSYTPPVGQLPIANGKNKFLGTVYSTTDAQINKYFNQITPENDGKWGSVETSDGVFNWAKLDVARQYAKDNNFPYRFHVLVWGNQQPTWLKPLSDDEKVIRIKRWFQSIASHYDGSTNARAVLEYIEVVNEILNDPPDNSGANATDNGSGDYLNALRSMNAELGTTPGDYDWVVNAYKLARKYFPCETKLVINDYKVENEPAKTAAYATIIQLLKNENLIDVVGIQCHSFSTQKYGSGTYAESTANLTTNLNTLAALGLPIMITEFDIDGNVSLDASGNRVTTGTQAEKDEFQRSEYARIFGLYWNHPSVIGITLWGYRTGMWRTSQAAYLMETCVGAERPAMSAYLNNVIRNGANPALGNSFIPSICGIPDDIQVTCPGEVPAALSSAITVKATNCPGDINVIVSDAISDQTSPSNYIINRTWSVIDQCGNANTASQVIIVNDTIKPSIDCSSGDIIATFNPAVCGYTLEVPNTIISDNCGNTSQEWIITRNSNTEASGTGNIGLYTFGLGVSTIEYIVTDASGKTNSCTYTITVNPLSVAPELSILPNVQQYSDKVAIKLVIPDGVSTCVTAAGSATFTITNGTAQIISTSALIANGSDLEATFETLLSENPESGLMAPGDKTVSVVLNGINNSEYIVGTAESKILTIIPEDARITFTGPQLISTESNSSGQAIVTLRATIQDISATSDAFGDNENGDIRKAKVRFLNNSAPIAISGLTDADGWIINEPALIIPTDKKTGVVSLVWPVNIGNEAFSILNIGIEVGDYYTRNANSDNTFVTIYKANSDLITGSGIILPNQSKGAYPSDPALPVIFAFNAKNSKCGKSTKLDGDVIILYFRTEGTKKLAYEISSGKFISLGADISNPAAKTAVFIANARLKNISNPLRPVLIAENLSLQVNIIDNGEPGVKDKVAISLYSGNNLWYSSNWTGNYTEFMKLKSGNLVVHKGVNISNLKSANDYELSDNLTGFGLFNIEAWPNPTQSVFTINVQSENLIELVELYVYDSNGKLVHTYKTLPNANYSFGEDLNKGIYFIESRQGDNRTISKLIKE